MARPARRQRWSWFVIGVGAVLLVLCLAEPSTVALVAGLALLLIGIVALVAGF